MNGLLIIALSIMVLGVAYLIYGRWIAKTWGIDENAVTPAYSKEDGEDYIPTSKAVVFSHQFSSIAGAGPVTGPIIAAMFGWVPVLLWLLIGGIFFGAVHDFGALYASVKSQGKSIGAIIEQYIGKAGRKLFFLFAWIFSLLVIAAFADIVATTFNGINSDGSLNTPNAAAASISMLFIVVAMAFGLFIKYKKPSGKLQFFIGVVLLVAMLAVGIAFPMYFSKNIWLAVVFVYLFLASITPMWLLMQPRDYLSTFLLIAMIVGAVLGIIVANPAMNLPAFTGFQVNGKMLFPTLFITKDHKETSFNKLMTNKYFATILTLIIGALLSLGGYNNVWPLFGAANQLLSALVLIALAVFLKSTSRKGFMVWGPMGIMLCVTFTALSQALIGIFKKIFVTHTFVFLTDGLQRIFAMLLIVLGFMVAVAGFKKLFKSDKNKKVVA